MQHTLTFDVECVGQQSAWEKADVMLRRWMGACAAMSAHYSLVCYSADQVLAAPVRQNIGATGDAILDRPIQC